MSCENCPEKRRADYWHRVTTTILSIIGGVGGALVASLVIRLLGN